MSITLLNKLTGQEWHFGASAGLTALGLQDGAAGLATFNDFPQGLYSVINDGADDVQVVLWGQTYAVAANSKWDFMAHSEVASISSLVARTADERFRGEPPTETEPEPEPEPDPPDTTTGGAASTTTDTAPNP